MESNNGVTQFGYFENMTSVAPNKATDDKNSSLAQFGYFQDQLDEYMKINLPKFMINAYVVEVQPAKHNNVNNYNAAKL
jgi:hypothetical protein